MATDLQEALTVKRFPTEADTIEAAQSVFMYKAKDKDIERLECLYEEDKHDLTISLNTLIVHPKNAT